MPEYDARQHIRVTRRIQEAIGYLELGLPEQAVRCLDDLGDVGPLALQVAMIRAEILRQEKRFNDAAELLEHVVETVPAPHNRPALVALSMCYRQAGETDLAVQTLGQARGAQLPLPGGHPAE